MQKYKEINGNDYVKNSRTTINETMQSIQSMNSGTAFPTNNLFEGMKCYRTDLKKTYTLTDVENNTWVEDAHATLSDEATHAASATKLQTARSLNLGGAVTADAATFDGTANATINVKTLDATKLKGTASVSTTGNAATATKVVATAAAGASANIAEATMASSDYARIRVSGNDNAGELALETADDGSEPIVARQYTGAYTNAVRTAKILDESGNTSFPGTVVAPKFTGALNGNAATATKLQTARTLSLSGKASGSTTFDGSSNAAINVTSVNADTASKLSTARKINITGNATGAATFDGTSDVSINVSVSQAAHADKATQDTNGRSFTDTNAYMHISALADNTDFNNVKTTGIYYCTGNTYPNRPHNSWGILTVYSIGTVKQEYKPDNAAVYYTREYNNANWTAWSKVNAANADTAAACSGNSATATKLATARAISLTGNVSGSANFDGSGNISISTTVNESKHAAAADNSNKLASESGSNYLFIDTEEDNWSVIGPNPGNWLKSIRTDVSAPPYSIGNYSTAIAFGGRDTKGIITHAYNSPDVKFAGGSGSTAGWKFTIHGGSNNETYDLNNFPTKTGNGASGTWGINISGNAKTATTATTAGNVSGKIYYSADSPSIATDKLFTVKQAHGGEDNVPNNGLVIQTGPTGANYNGKLYITDNGNDGVWIGGVAAGKEVGWTRLVENKGTWGINISGNAASATNADKLDGYHASDIINRISAANTGGIVAASLTENGYVKFANGLILQWGSPTVSKELTFTYPVAMSTFLFATMSPITGGIGEADSAILNASGTSCYVHNSSGREGKVFILVVGLS